MSSNKTNRAIPNAGPHAAPHAGNDKPALTTGPGRYAYDGLERVIHERARLSIMTSLGANPRGLLFNDLRQLCALTDGNLNRHLAVLEEASLVEAWKGHHNRRPQTLYRLTVAGRRKMLDYVAELERVLADAMAAEKRWPAENGGLNTGPGGGPIEGDLRPA